MNVKEQEGKPPHVGERVLVVESLFISPQPTERLLTYLKQSQVEVVGIAVLWDAGSNNFDFKSNNIDNSNLVSVITVDVGLDHENSCDCRKYMHPQFWPVLKYDNYGNFV